MSPNSYFDVDDMNRCADILNLKLLRRIDAVPDNADN